MRRVAPLLLGVAFLLAGCGSSGTVEPTAEKVVGSVPTTTTTAKAPPGDAKAGAKVFADSGCGGCHTFKPAGSNKTIGPDLDKLAGYAKTAGASSTADFARESIQNPGAYVEKGYSNIMPNFGQSLTDKQISDLVAYLTKG
jgi:mono/diheme cytochrome c family protein